MARIEMPPIAGWSEQHERELRALQVDELYRSLPFATGAAFLSAGLTLAVLMDTGAGAAGVYWFIMFSLVTLYRCGILIAQSGNTVHAPETWAQLAIVGNIAAGLLWGLLGTVFFPETSSYRELFIVMVICCNVGGSVSSYAPVKWAHPAVALPAVVPPLFYLTFARDGLHVYSALTAFVFMISVTGIALQQHRRITQRLRLTLENRELMRRLSGANSSLLRQNSDLELRAAERLQSALTEKDRADLLALHFAKTPLAIIECDADLRLVSWNEATRRLLGLSIDRLRGQPLLTAICVEGEGDVIGSAIRKVAADGSPLSCRGNFFTLDRRLKKGSFHITALQQGKESPMRVAIIISDWRDNGDARSVA